MERDMKRGSIAVISPIQAKATVAGVTDGKQGCIMIEGKGSDIMHLIEDMVIHIIYDAYKKKLAEADEQEAVKLSSKALATFCDQLKDKLTEKLVQNKIQRDLEGIPDFLSELLAKAVMKMNDNDKEQEEEEEKEDEE